MSQESPSPMSLSKKSFLSKTLTTRFLAPSQSSVLRTSVLTASTPLLTERGPNISEIEDIPEDIQSNCENEPEERTRKVEIEEKTEEVMEEIEENVENCEETEQIGEEIREIQVKKLVLKPKSGSEGEDKLWQMDVFASKMDIGETYKMEKMMANQATLEQLELFLQKCEKVQVIGLCGSDAECDEVVRQLMNCDYLEERDKKTNCIRAYWQQSSQRLCLHFNHKDKTLYSFKPFRPASKETIFFRLLLDLCPTVIICPNDALKQHWEAEKHPFLPSSFESEEITFESREIPQTKIDELTEERKLDIGQVTIQLDSLLKALQVAPNTLSKSISSEDLHIEAQEMTPKHRPLIKEVYTKREVLETEIPTHPAKLLLTNDHFPYVFIQTAERFDSVKVNKHTRETLGSFLYTAHKYIMTNGRIGEEKFNEFAGFGEFLAALEKYENMENIAANLKKYLDLATNEKSELQKIYKKCIKSLNKDILSDLQVAAGYLKEAGKMVLGTLSAPTHFAKLCFKEYDHTRVLGCRTHANAVAINPVRAKQIIEMHIVRWQEGMIRRCEEYFNWKFREILEIVVKELTIKPELEGSYIVKLERFELQLHINSVVCSSSRLTTSFQTPDYPTSSTAFLLDKDIAFSFFTSDCYFQATKFNPDSHGFSESSDLKVIPGGKLVNGSNSQCFVLINNDARRVYYGQVLEGKWISSGNALDVFGREVRMVRDACFLPETKVLYVINELGKVYFLDLKQPQGVNLVEKLQSAPEFFQIRTAAKEKVFILSSIDTYFIYNDDQFERPIRCKAKGCHKLPLKVVSKDYNHYIISYDESAVGQEVEERGRKKKAFRVFPFVVKGQYNIQKGGREMGRRNEEIWGNPIVDGFVYGLKSFGYNFERQPEGQKSFFIYLQEEEKRTCKETYPRVTPLSTYFSSFAPISFHDLPSLSVPETPSSELIWTLGSRQPVHIASIQSGKLIPLSYGKMDLARFRHEVPENSDNYVQNFLNYAKFGYIETLIQRMENPFVLSIMGKQSSGKSYLLNRLFDTRFDVASSRCTDGVWLSVARCEGRDMVVLDCEGLFSVERTEVEEIMLCLFLAAVSDVTILNQDLAMGKYLVGLMGKFERARKRIHGAELFKGMLAIVIRDVSEFQGAYEDLIKVITTLSRQHQAQFIQDLFSGNDICVMPLHYFESPEFESDLDELRNVYMERNPHWSSGSLLLKCMKATLAQINSNDMESLDSRIASNRIEDSKTQFRSKLTNCKNIGELIGGHAEVVENLTIADVRNIVKFKISEVTCAPEQVIPWINRLLEDHFPDIRRDHFNEFYLKAQHLIETLISVADKELEEKFMNSIPHADEKKEELSTVYKIHLRNAFTLHNVSICLQKCAVCKRVCILNSKHDGECTCKTTHQCISKCQSCGNRCESVYGHEEEGEGHDCGNAHDCGEKCHFCRRVCMKGKSHPGIHRCPITRHQCEAGCGLGKFCNRQCEKSMEEPHDSHRCGMKVCGKPCSTKGCQQLCVYPDHLHSVKGTVKCMCSSHEPGGSSKKKR